MSIVSLFLTLLFSIVFRNFWLQGLVVGLILTTAFLVIDLKITANKNKLYLKSIIHEKRGTIKSHIDESNYKIFRFLRIEIEYFHNKELFDIFNKIISLYKEAQFYNYNLSTYCFIINHKINEVQKTFYNGVMAFTIDDEHKRASILEDIILKSSKYVYAVTFDENEYLDTFWSGLFPDKYVKSNLEKAKTGVPIERIFVVDERIINNNNLSNIEVNKRNNLIEICKKLNQETNCSAYWIAKESLPEELLKTNTSFLVCDDINASESHGMKEGQKIDGYVYQGSKEDMFARIIRPLKNRFFQIKKHKNYQKCSELNIQ
ncbi:MAG: hypothetical protein AAGE84_13930 [Cyanobacteria bacterium P01_G01_bin.39]